jgi:hypothetical protein
LQINMYDGKISKQIYPHLTKAKSIFLPFRLYLLNLLVFKMKHLKSYHGRILLLLCRSILQ